MKKIILSLSIVLTSFSSFAQNHTIEETMKKIQPIIYYVGQHRMYTCIKSSYFSAEKKVPTEGEFNSNCKKMIENFFSIDVKIISSVMEVASEEGGYASDKALEIRDLLANQNSQAKKNLINLYEILLRTNYPLGPDDPMTDDLKVLVEYVRKYNNLAPMSYEECRAVIKSGFAEPNCESLKVPVNQISAEEKKE